MDWPFVGGFLNHPKRGIAVAESNKILPHHVVIVVRIVSYGTTYRIGRYFTAAHDGLGVKDFDLMAIASASSRWLFFKKTKQKNK